MRTNKQGRYTNRTNVDLAIVRAALEHADRESATAAARAAGVSHSTVSRWMKRRELAGGAWPTDADVLAWQQADRAADQQRAAHRRWQLRTMARGGPLLVDSTGTARRLQALLALGYRYADIAALTPYKIAFIGHLATARRPMVNVDSAERVKAVYEQLSGSPGPSQKTRTYARNRGWAPPLAWDDDSIDDPQAQPAHTPAPAKRTQALDEVAIYRATHGDRVQLTTAERREAVRILTERGQSKTQIAATLHVAERIVERDRSAA